jgi:hypothetical protein
LLGIKEQASGKISQFAFSCQPSKPSGHRRIELITPEFPDGIRGWGSGTAMRLIFTIAGLLALVGIGSAQALDVDWKAYGFASVDGDSVCFYDARGIVRRSDGHIRVWTKCLLVKDMDSIDRDLNKQLVDNAARKLIDKYVPPIARVDERIGHNASLNIMMYEEIANFGNIEPVAKFFKEINCSEGMIRELSIEVRINGEYGYDNKPTDWQYVSPESNGARLLKIHCRGEH